MTTRMYGLSGSGVDVDSMVKQMMTAKRAPLDKMFQQKTLLEWKKTDYSDMYTKLKTFRNTAFDFKLSGSLSPMKTTSTNEAVATATASGDAAAVSHTISVKQLAAGASVTTAALGSGTDKTTLASQLSGSVGALPADPATTFTVNLNGKDITVDKTKSIYDFISDVNKANVGVKATYDATLDRVFFNSSTTGSTAKIDFSANAVGSDGYNFLTNGLKVDAATVTKAGGEVGKNAIFTLDGMADLEKASNIFTIAGVTYTLKKEDAATPANATATIGVSKDIDKTVANVKAFVDTYNTLLDAVNTTVNEKRYKDYAPLTTDQKTNMSADEIKKWEEYAKSGMLRNDPTLTNLVSSMRSAFSDRVSGISSKYNNAAAIGITTGSYLENGKLYVDEAKLKKALEEDPDAVTNIFGSTGDTASQKGVANRLYDTLKTAMDKIDDTAGVLKGSADTQSTMAKEITDYTTRMTNLTSRLNDLENRYYKQFTAMETALNKLNSQASWLQQSGGSSSSK